MRASFAEKEKRNRSSRCANPNNTELVDKLCQLEGAEAGHTFATGMGAIFSSFAALLNSGDHVLSARAVFGSTHTLFTKIFPKWNIQTTYFFFCSDEVKVPTTINQSFPQWISITLKKWR